MTTISYKRLYKKILSDATVNLRGIHGPSHWAHVIRNGIYISEKEHLSPVVMKCFALLHDSQRLNDNEDPYHGQRAADYAISIRETYLDITDIDFERLVLACTHHTKSIETSDIFVHACWDADRLDLGRVGITPDSYFLNTQTAKLIAEGELFHLLEDFKPSESLLAEPI